jgi:hypothetical protein
MRRNHNTATQTSVTRFALGQTFITPGAEEALQIAGQTAIEFLRRHMSCDWGELSEDDIAENELSLKQGFRLLSNYQPEKGSSFGSSPKQTVAQLRSCSRPSTKPNRPRKKRAARVLPPPAPLTP